MHRYYPYMGTISTKFQKVFNRKNAKGLIVLAACVVGAIVIVVASVVAVSAGSGDPGDNRGGNWASAPGGETDWTIGGLDMPLPGTGMGQTIWLGAGQSYQRIKIGQVWYTNILIGDINAIYSWHVTGDAQAARFRFRCTGEATVLEIQGLTLGELDVFVYARGRLNPLRINIEVVY